MLSELLGLVVPPRCALCGGECAAREPLCDGCESALARLAPCLQAIPGVDAAWSAAPYEGIARDLVVALKFQARLPLAKRAGAVIAARAPPDLLQGTIVPVPPAPAAAAMARVRRGGGDRRGAQPQGGVTARALPSALPGEAPGRPPASGAAGQPATGSPRGAAAGCRRLGGRRGHDGSDARRLRQGAANRRLRPRCGPDLRPLVILSRPPRRAKAPGRHLLFAPRSATLCRHGIGYASRPATQGEEQHADRGQGTEHRGHR